MDRGGDHVDRRLGLPTAMLLVIASMVGTGVFTTTGFLLRDIGSIAAVLASWGVGGAVALFGALAYAELVAALPHNGGEYQLLSRIYHPGFGFAAGFTSLVVGFSAPTAASAIAFAEYADMSLGGGVLPAIPLAVGLIVVTAALHAFEVRLGGRFQNVFTIGKVLLIVVFVVAGAFSGDASRLTAESTRPFMDALSSPAFAVGLIYVSFSYSGWNAAAYVAGEVREPQKNLPRALMLGTLVVTVLYLGLNFVFIGAAEVDTLIAAEERVGAVAAIGLFGDNAGRALAGVIALGLVSTVGALVMTGPRVYEAMGRDHRAIALLARRRASGGPILAIGLQAAISIVMVLTASFDALLTYIGFTLSFFAAMTVFGVFVLRRREPSLARPYRTWGHPFTSLAFIALSGWMVVFAITLRPVVALVGVGTIVTGFLSWWMLDRSPFRVVFAPPMTAPTTPRKNLFRLILGIVAVVGIAAYPIYWLAIGHGTPAQTIYVAVTAEPAAWARGLRNAMAERLSRQGLEVVEVETPPSDLDWDGALAESEARGAHYLVHVTLTRDDERPGLTEGMTFAVATGELRVGPVDQEEASPSEPWSLTFGAEARGDATAAILETIPDFTDPFAHWAAGALFGMPALADIQIAEPANPLGAALDKKRDQDRSLAQYEAMCVESIVELTIDDERGPGPFTCLDVDCGERYLFGLSRDGRHALVHVDTPRSFVPFAMSPAPHAANTLERLVLVPLDGGEATTVATARSFYGHGTLSDDGSRAAFVEQAALRFGVVALEIATGARRVLSIAERPGMVIEARISPDGQWVAHHQKAFNRAHTELHVTRFDGAEPSVISRRTRDGLWLTAPLRPGENARQLLAFDGTESYEGAPRPALVDPAEPDDVVELDVGEHIVRQIVGAHDEKLVLLGSPRGDLDHCEIGIRDPETGDVEWRPIATCLEDTRMTDRFELTGSGVLSRRGPDVDDPDTTDPEAIVMDLETGQTTIHTTNRAIERNVHAAGNRIAFERRVLSQYPAVHPNAVCWTER